MAPTWTLYVASATISAPTQSSDNCTRGGGGFPQNLNLKLKIDPLCLWRVYSNYNKHILKTLPCYQYNAQFLYSITIYMLHYNPQHVSSSTLLIFRRTNCIITASGVVTLCKQPYSMPVESGLSHHHLDNNHHHLSSRSSWLWLRPLLVWMKEITSSLMRSR